MVSGIFGALASTTVTTMASLPFGLPPMSPSSATLTRRLACRPAPAGGGTEHAVRRAAAVFTSPWGPMIRVVGMSREAANTASCGPRASAPLSEEREITLSEVAPPMPFAVPVSLPWIEPGHAKVLQGLAQMPGTHGVRLVVVEKLDPAGRIGRMVDGQRSQDGHADGIRYLVALA